MKVVYKIVDRVKSAILTKQGQGRNSKEWNKISAK